MTSQVWVHGTVTSSGRPSSSPGQGVQTDKGVADVKGEENSDVTGIRYSDVTAIKFSDVTAIKYSDVTAIKYSDVRGVGRVTSQVKKNQ